MNINSKKTVLITGGAGYIGSKVATDLINKKFKVIIIDNLSTGYESLIPKKAIFYKLNIINLKKIKKIIKKYNPYAILHFAASLSVSESQKKPLEYFKNNVLGTKKIIEASIDTSVKNFVFSSTCAVYKGSLKSVNENSLKKPSSIYGKTKLLAENIIIKKLKKTKINYSILRYFNVGGADLKNKIGCINKNNQLIKNLSYNIARKKNNINVYGKNYKTKDGTCIRDYVFINDISKFHFFSLKYISTSKKNIILNCGYGKGYSVLEIIKNFEKYSKRKINIKFKKRRAGDLSSVICNNRKLVKFLKVKLTRKPLQKIIQSSLLWEKYLSEKELLTK